MAIFGKLIDIQKQFQGSDKLVLVFDYLTQAVTSNTDVNARILSMDCDRYERIEITSDIFAIEQSYNTKNPEDSLFESHNKYADFQLLILGKESIRVSNRDFLKVKSEYNKEDDYSLYKANDSSSAIVMREGDLSIFFSNDAHMPGVCIKNKTERVFKTVVKIPLSLLY